MNLFFSSVWQKKVWRMNRSAKGLLIITTNLVWQIADDSTNSPTFYLPNFPAIQYIRMLPNHVHMIYCICSNFQGCNFSRFIGDFTACEFFVPEHFFIRITLHGVNLKNKIMKTLFKFHPQNIQPSKGYHIAVWHLFALERTG